MFSFKPRVFRSAEGCCICRAKSSSSRFTDSRKYEEDSIKCFDLKHPRHGEICNACVLLVKRYKRLPAGSQRNWSHVVDARAGPGTKTLTKVKRLKEENFSEQTRHISKSILTEKFSKIFKKSKKVKTQSPTKKQFQTTSSKQSNSTESEHENDSRESSPGLTNNTNSSTHSIVLFQTQTRASAFRLKNKNKQMTVRKSDDLIILKISPKIIGCKKRKKFKPKKLEKPYEDEVKFFDDNEWKKRKTCCGIFYECAKLNGAIMIDPENYKICTQHQRKETIITTNIENKQMNSHIPPKPKCVIKASLPTVVKLNLPPTLNSNIKATPVLKKHHLFFKRQSESFPQIDTTVKTDICTFEAATTSKTAAKIDNQISIFKQNDEIQHSKITPQIVTAVPSVAVESSLNIKSANFLHKIKSDAGKIVKHSIDKFNAAIRLKPHELSEIKHLVKTVDKNVLLSKTTVSSTITSQNIVSNVITTTPLPTDNLSPSSTSSTSSSVTTTSSTKFSDNSSDSGFDENVQERKTISPLLQENDLKERPLRSPVQTIILSSGVRIHGQSPNLVYAGTEPNATKILQHRIQQQNAITLNSNTVLQHNNKRLNVQSNEATSMPTGTFKIVQAKPNSNGVISIGAYNIGNVKMLYNNNAIKHENGITTIVPANQINQCAVQTNAPNTITITPSSSVSMQRRPISLNIVNQQKKDTITQINNRRAI